VANPEELGQQWDARQLPRRGISASEPVLRSDRRSARVRGIVQDGHAHSTRTPLARRDGALEHAAVSPFAAIRRSRRALVALALSFACGLMGCSAPRHGAPRPAPASHGGALTLTVENDSFSGSDNNYTSGIGLGWSTDEVGNYGEGSFVRGWAELWSFLPFVLDEGHSTYASWTVGQEMHTPDDISDPDPPPTDQPYAGVLYVDSILAARGHDWEHRWSLRLGVVGPASQADDTQTWFHDVIGADEPMGWDQQLPNEPLINLGYDAAYLLFERELGTSAKLRLVPVGGAAVGNYFTGANLGLYGEFGWNLVDAFGISALRGGFDTSSTIGVGPVEGWSVSFFGSVGGTGIAHYLPLDGTVFSDSRSVDSEPFVGSVSAGLTLRRGRFVLGFARTITTSAFETQTENAEFGTVSISWFF